MRVQDTTAQKQVAAYPSGGIQQKHLGSMVIINYIHIVWFPMAEIVLKIKVPKRIPQES